MSTICKNSEIQLYISKTTKEKLSIFLDPEKVLMSKTGYYRDWRGVFSLSGLTQLEYGVISQCNDKTEHLLKLWMDKNTEKGIKTTVHQLKTILATIDRNDIVEDISLLLDEDAKQVLLKSLTPDNSKSTNHEIFDSDSNVITHHDIECVKNNLPFLKYDAFVIYSDQDVQYASELIERCEKLGFRLCYKDRDFLGGLAFESESVLNLLNNRCNSLIVIISEAFLDSKMNIFITNYARALGIEQDIAKVIPVIVEPCKLPIMLQFCYPLEYFRNKKVFNFWKKLEESLKANSHNELLCTKESEKFEIESTEIVDKKRIKHKLKAFRRSFLRVLQHYRKLSTKTTQTELGCCPIKW